MSVPIDPKRWRNGCVSLAGLALLLAATPTQAGPFARVSFEVSSRGLGIRGDVYGKVVPFSAMQVESARIVDLELEPQYRSWYALNGLDLPGYSSGWHKLRSKEKGLIFEASSKLGVYVPTTLGYCIVVTPERPEEFLAALQGRGAVTRAFPIAGDADGSRTRRLTTAVLPRTFGPKPPSTEPSGFFRSRWAKSKAAQPAATR